MGHKVPFVNYPEHYRRIWGEVMDAITEALSKGDLILRDQLRQFEENIASFVGVKYAVGVNSGTDALYLSLKAAGVGEGDEVIHHCCSYFRGDSVGYCLLRSNTGIGRYWRRYEYGCKSGRESNYTKN